MALTQRECIAASLQSFGYVSVPTRSNKYMAFATPAAPTQIYFIGKSGGLRYGRNVSESVSVLETTRKRWLNLGKTILEKK